MTAPVLPDAPRTRAQQFAFLRAAHTGPLQWKALCLSLARQAPGLPAIYPSALAAQVATPKANRVPDVGDLRRGMVAYFDDPSDSNKFGHIATVAGWDQGRVTGDLADLLVWSNDAARTGGVDLVRASFFPARWGDGFVFGATCLNGYDLPGYDDDVPTPQPGRGSIGPNLDYAIRDIERAYEWQKAAGHAVRAAALARDLAELRQTRKRFP